MVPTHEKHTTGAHFTPTVLCVLAGFQPKLFHAQKMNSFHRAIGNAKESRGVVDPTKETMKRLVALINAGLAKLRT